MPTLQEIQQQQAQQLQNLTRQTAGDPFGALINGTGAQAGALQQQLQQEQNIQNAQAAANPQTANLERAGNLNNVTASNNQYADASAKAANQQQLQQALNQQQNLYGQLAGQNGIGNQGQVFNQQQQLANQLQGVANGQGPNPAQAMLNQQTGQNVAQQAALMAGQRGSSANAGLLARQAAQQGAATQQQAVGQGASMQAQQSLAALGQLQNQQANMANLATTQVGQQQGALGQQAGLANQLTQNNLANSQQALQQQQLQYGQVNQQNQQALNQQQGINNINAGMAQQVIGGQNQMNLQQQQQGNDTTSGILKGLGTAAMLLNQGGEVEGPKSAVGKFLKGGLQNFTGSYAPAQQSQQQQPQKSGSQALTEGLGTLLANKLKMAKGGKVPALLSPGELYVPPSQTKKVADGKESANHAGKRVPGKAKVKGDSLKNDTVPAKLEEGGIVIPRSIATSKDAPKKAAAFVRAVLAKQGLRGKKK